MKTKKVVPQTREEKERELSKDELVQLFIKSTEDCVKLASDLTVDAIPVLLFVQQALDQDDLADGINMRMPDGTMYPYCHAGNGAAIILRWLAEDQHEKWNEVDAVHMKVFSVIEAIKKGEKPVLRGKSRA